MPVQNSDIPKLSLADLSFESDNSTAVISEAHKFIIPVPNLGAQAEPLVYPADHPDAGQPILNYKGRPVGEKGLAFFNVKDQAWQAVPGDGEGVVIINEVTPAQAAQLDQKIRELSSIDNLSVQNLKDVLHYARETLGLSDVYNSTRSYVKEKLTPVSDEAPSSFEQAYGLMRRDKEDIYQAVYIPDQFSLEGPTATAQVFKHGGVILAQAGRIRGIQPEIFLRTYRRADGQPISTIEDLNKMSGPFQHGSKKPILGNTIGATE